MDPIAWVDECYFFTSHSNCYKEGLEPINGPKMWPMAEGMPIKPPHHKPMPGKPKKNRKKCKF
ncbi:hypothetical protein, partial [Vibrio vulnificus]|uniref:hypothetical protein n=1 Tax=Vibrio vulnificus TaxID=672 RepID=UPI0019D4A5A4